MKLTESSLTTVSIFLKPGSGSMLTTIISSGKLKNIKDHSHLCHHFTPKHRNYVTVISFHACCWPVVGSLVRPPEDELPQAGDGVRAHQSVASKSSAVHHSDVERRVKQLVLRQILVHANTNTLYCPSKQRVHMEMGLVSNMYNILLYC